jgi:integrase/recombinase XerD
LNDPSVDLELMKEEKTLPKHVLKAEEVDQVLNAIDISSPAGLRDRALFELMYSTGIRRGELVKLKVTDLDAEKGTLRVRHGKGKKERVSPIGERAVLWVMKYLEEVRPFWAPLDEDDGTLFVTDRRTPIALHTLSKIGRRRMEESGLYQTGDACHIYRHSAATAMLEHGADVRYIQQYLGHAQITTTQIYTRVTIDKLKEVHTATHPSAVMKKESAGDDSSKVGR